MLVRVCGSPDQGWETVTDRMGVLIAIKRDIRDCAPLVLPDQLGVVLGRLFVREGDGEHDRLVTNVVRADAFDLVSMSGEAFTQTHWGPYCAILHDRFANTLRIIRDPMGSRPIFRTQSGELAIAFTHLSDFLAAGLVAQIDDVGLRGFLTDVRLVTERTGMAGVRELLAGCELRMAQDRQDVVTVWFPEQRRTWTRNAFPEAASAVRASAQRVGETWATTLPRALHRLSGGLNSSIALSLLNSRASIASRTLMPSTNTHALQKAMSVPKREPLLLGSA